MSVTSFALLIALAALLQILKLLYRDYVIRDIARRGSQPEKQEVRHEYDLYTVLRKVEGQKPLFPDRNQTLRDRTRMVGIVCDVSAVAIVVGCLLVKVLSVVAR